MARLRVVGALFVALALFSATVLEARDRPIREIEPGKRKYLAYNVSLTALFTLISARVQHQVRSPRDAMNLLLVGAGAGFTFYEAKRIAGVGRTTEGWLLANAASTVVENSTSGEQLFGRIGYTVGPLRFRFATPLARTPVAATIEADWSLAETGDLIMARYYGDHFRFRHGLIAVDRNKPWSTTEVQSGGFYGRTYGVFAGVAPFHDQPTWPHEMVHVIQDQQMDSVEPAIHTFGGDVDPAKPRPLFAFRHVRLGFVQILDSAEALRRYQERWNEVEAYGLAQRTPVQP